MRRSDRAVTNGQTNKAARRTTRRRWRGRGSGKERLWTLYVLMNKQVLAFPVKSLA